MVKTAALLLDVTAGGHTFGLFYVSSKARQGINSMGLKIISAQRFSISAMLLLIFGSFAIALSAADSSVTAAKDTSHSTKKDTAVSHGLPVKPQGSPVSVTMSFGMYDTLAGPLPDTVKGGNKPYLVVGDIEVPVGKTVTIGRGVVFLFKTFTGMHVLGKLSINGTQDAPVVFTSENDRSVNQGTKLYPNPFDWNGIYIHSDAVGSSFSYCKVLYSVYGIVSETKFIKLDQVTIHDNGKSNLVIEGKEQQISDKPYRYVLSTKDVAAEGVPVKILTDPFASKRAVLRYGGIAVGMAATVGALYYGLKWNRDQADLTARSSNAAPALKGHAESEWFSLQTQRNNDIYYTAATGVLAFIGYIGFGWSFAF